MKKDGAGDKRGEEPLRSAADLELLLDEIVACLDPFAASAPAAVIAEKVRKARTFVRGLVVPSHEAPPQFRPVAGSQRNHPIPELRELSPSATVTSDSALALLRRRKELIRSISGMGVMALAAEWEPKWQQLETDIEHLLVASDGGAE